MKNIILFIIAVFICTLSITNAKAQTIPIVQADTVFQGFGGGSVSGIVFGPTGETVIVMHDAQPVEINIKTKQIVREFEKVPNSLGDQYLIMDKTRGLLSINTRCTELLGTKDFSGNVFWDMVTGKIIKTIPNVVLLSNGKQYYSYIIKDKKQYIGLFNIDTYKFIDSVEFDQGWVMGEQTRFSAGFGIIPNSNKVLIGANGANYKGRSKLYVLDFDTKKYTEIPIPYDDGQESSTITRINVSETGKYFVVTMDVVNDLTAYLFYDKDFKFVFKETRKHLNNLFDEAGIYLNFWETNFIHDDYLICPFEIWSVPEQQYFYYADFYSISEKSIKKRILFTKVDGIDYFENNIIIGNAFGIIGLLKFDALPVENDLRTKTIQNIQYKDNNLIINTTITDKVEIDLSDYNGGLLFSQKDVYLRSGVNTIKLNHPLANGVYFCLIKSTTESNSFKFMVSR